MNALHVLPSDRGSPNLLLHGWVKVHLLATFSISPVLIPDAGVASLLSKQARFTLE